MVALFLFSMLIPICILSQFPLWYAFEGDTSTSTTISHSFGFVYTHYRGGILILFLFLFGHHFDGMTQEEYYAYNIF